MKVDIELLRRLRAQMLVHCYLYYWQDAPIWSDSFWQHQADRLESLQKEYLESGLSIDIGFYDDAFRDFSGATGAHLPRDEYVINKANQIYHIHNHRNVDFNSQAGVK